MAQVTVELRNLLKSNFELFDFDYQFDDPQMKASIEDAIIQYYYDYEIGQETPDMFKRKFKARFKQLIGYYNDLHNTTLLTYNPLSNYSISEALEQLANTTNKVDGTSNVTASGTGKNDSTVTSSEDTLTDTLTTNNLANSSENLTTNNLTSTSNGSGTTNSTEQTSDYPQQPIAGGDFLNGSRVADTTTAEDNTTTNTGTVQNAGSGTSTGTVSNAATSGTDGTSTTSGTSSTSDTAATIDSSTGSGTQTTEYSKTIEGLTGLAYQDLVMKERQTLIRITGQIIEELKPCFILVH